MADRSQCRECRTALPLGAKYCLECGASVTPLVVDLLRFDDPALSAGTGDVTPHPRRGLWAVLALFAVMVLVLWGLTRTIDRPTGQAGGADNPEDRTAAADVTTSTTVVATTAPQTTTSERLFVNDVPGPVLSDDVEGVLVRIGSSAMDEIDLATGAIERIELEHAIYVEDSQSSIAVSGKVIVVRSTSIIITDLSDGSQKVVPRGDAVGLSDLHVAGRAAVDSVWLATYPGPDRISEAIEIDVEGEVGRRVKIPQPFSITWAEGHELILDSPDGSFRYDTETGVVERMPGQVMAFEPGFVVTSSCDESLLCDVRLDQGSGPEVVDWLSASDVFEGSIDVSPDLSGALLHTYTQEGAEFTFIDLHTSSRVDLGRLPIEPYRGVVWVEGSSWIIGHNESPNVTLAIDTETGAQVELDFGTTGFSSPPFLAFTSPS